MFVRQISMQRKHQWNFVIWNFVDVYEIELCVKNMPIDTVLSSCN